MDIPAKLKSLSLPILVAASCAVALSACAVPPAVTAISYAADGVAYVVSGKSVSDHAMSLVLEQDCAVFRVFQGRLVCHDRGDDSDLRRHEMLSAVYGRYSPLNTPYEIVAPDSYEAVGESDGVIHHTEITFAEAVREAEIRTAAENRFAHNTVKTLP